MARRGQGTFLLVSFAFLCPASGLESPALCLGEHRGQRCAAAHAVLAWKPAVIECVHVDDGISLDHHGRLRLVLDPTLAGKGETDLIRHSAAEGTLCWGEGSGREEKVFSEVWSCQICQFFPLF